MRHVTAFNMKGEAPAGAETRWQEKEGREATAISPARAQSRTEGWPGRRRLSGVSHQSVGWETGPSAQTQCWAPLLSLQVRDGAGFSGLEMLPPSLLRTRAQPKSGPWGTPAPGAPSEAASLPGP